MKPCMFCDTTEYLEVLSQDTLTGIQTVLCRGCGAWGPYGETTGFKYRRPPNEDDDDLDYLGEDKGDPGFIDLADREDETAL